MGLEVSYNEVESIKAKQFITGAGVFSRAELSLLCPGINFPRKRIAT